MDRETFLVVGTVVALAVSLSELSWGAVDDDPAAFPFGIGSAEVRTKSASLWTQTTAQAVTVEIARDDTFTAPVRVIPVAVDPNDGGTVRVNIDASTGPLTIEPKGQNGALIAGKEQRGRGVDFWCHNYVATAT